MEQKTKSRIHLRIFREITYLFMLVLLIFLEIFLHSHFLLTVLVLMILLPILSITLAWRMKDSLSVTVKPFGQALQEVEEGIWRVRIHNSSYGISLACTLTGKAENIFLGTSGELRIDMPISMKGTESFDLPLVSEYCGLIRVQIERMEYMDLLGLVSVSMDISAMGETVILPKEQESTMEQRSGFQAGISEAEESLAKGYDFAEVTDMREYRPGDRIKDIHWKLSAKKEELMVKERTSVAQSQVILVLDLSGDGAAITEIMRLAYGLTKAFLGEYVPVRLLWWDEHQYDFQEVLITEEKERRSGFMKLFHGHSSKPASELPELLQRVRPLLQSCIYLSMIQGKADGVVISHV